MNFSALNRLCIPSTTLLCLALAPSLQAQFFKPGHQAKASYSYSGPSSLNFKNASLGDLSAQYSEFEYARGAKVNDQLTTGLALGYQGSFLQMPQSLGLPEQLQELYLRVGGSYRLEGTQWSLFASASPGYREAGMGFNGKSFTVPVMAGATFFQKPGLIWSFGAAYNEFSDYKAMPFVGVNWQFAPKWALSVGYPQLGVTYTVNESLKLRAGASLKGGSYMAKEHLPSIPEAPAYRGTKLDYREIRVGVAADWQLSEGLKMTLEAGVVTDRKLKFHQRDVSYNSDPAAFVGLSLGYSL